MEQLRSRAPNSVNVLTRLPGVSRKTANLPATVALSKLTICVETYVHRIMNIRGLASNTIINSDC